MMSPAHDRERKGKRRKGAVGPVQRKERRKGKEGECWAGLAGYLLLFWAVFSCPIFENFIHFFFKFSNAYKINKTLLKL